MQSQPWLRRTAALLATVLLGACAGTQPWRNTPLSPGETIRYTGQAQMNDPGRAPDLLVVASFSGGGSRAAAFAHAVVGALDARTFVWQGRQTSLAREIDLVIGVSGGSVSAAHLALHGPREHLARFPGDFLQLDFEGRLIGAALSPAGLWRQTSPQFGRGNLLAEAFDQALFGGATFGDLADRDGRPYLIVGATDLSSGAEFDFTSEQFALLCSSIDHVPLAFAVAASSSVPLLFSPLSVQNHRASCPQPVSGQAGAPASPADKARMRLVKGELEALAHGNRRHVHLIDGGVSDNLGTRRITDYVDQVGGIGNVLRLLGVQSDGSARAPQRVVFVSVNSERRGPLPLDQSGDVPQTLAVLDAMIFSGLGRHSDETSLLFADAVAHWRQELRALSPGRNVDIFSIDVKLSELDDPALRERVLAIPTAFRISEDDTALLREAAQSSLKGSPELARFLRSLEGKP